MVKATIAGSNIDGLNNDLSKVREWQKVKDSTYSVMVPSEVLPFDKTGKVKLAQANKDITDVARDISRKLDDMDYKRENDGGINSKNISLLIEGEMGKRFGNSKEMEPVVKAVSNGLSNGFKEAIANGKSEEQAYRDTKAAMWHISNKLHAIEIKARVRGTGEIKYQAPEKPVKDAALPLVAVPPLAEALGTVITITGLKVMIDNAFEETKLYFDNKQAREKALKNLADNAASSGGMEPDHDPDDKEPKEKNNKAVPIQKVELKDQFDKTDGTKLHENVANAPRLKKDLLTDQALSIYTKDGKLRPEIIERAEFIPLRDGIKNQKVIRALTKDGSKIEDWGKFSTKEIKGPAGEFEVHFYKNKITGEVNYDFDFKTIPTDLLKGKK